MGVFIAILTKFCTRRTAEDSTTSTARRCNTVQGLVRIATLYVMGKPGQQANHAAADGHKLLPCAAGEGV